MEVKSILEIFIGALIAIVVGVALLPSVFSGVTTVTNNATYKAAFPSTVSLVTILPLIFAVIILVGAVLFLTFRE
ncbi:MAG: hypothetical protein QW203_06770 [Thermoplasmatales archaeon]